NVAYTIVTAAATSSDANYSGLNAADVAVTNNDNDVAGITVTPTSGLVTTEAGGTAIFTVTLNTQPASSVTIGLSSSDTTEGTVLPASLTFTTINWNTPQTVIVTGVDDLIVDGNVAYTIMTAAATSSDPHYNGLNATDVAVTNTDNDVVPKPIPMVPMRPAPWAVVPVAPTISVADVTVQVGTLATRAVFTVTLSAASTKTITMVYGTADGTAKAGIGYTRTTGTLTFSPGQTSQTIPVPIAALKSAGLANQTFSLNLTSAVNGKIGRAAATATIVDAVPVVVVPPPPVVAVIPAISIGSVIVTRPTTGTATVTFVVSLSAASTKSITVNYSTINGTALSGSDYTAAIGKLTFAPGVTSQTITVTILANSAKKTAAAFNMALSVPTNATLKTGQGTCTINNSVFTVLQPAAVNLVLARRLV
ncbi:MAG: Calx-beta domain-containing protein, partial [Planctomycetota bacterium]